MCLRLGWSSQLSLSGGFVRIELFVGKDQIPRIFIVVSSYERYLF